MRKTLLSLFVIVFFIAGISQAMPPSPAPHVTYDPTAVSVTGGTITGTTLAGVITTHSATEAVATATMYGNRHVCTGAYTLSLPAAVAGMSGLFVATTAAVMTLDPNGTQIIIHDRASLGAGVTLVSDGTAYAIVYLECVVTGTWIAYVNMGTFAAGS